MAFVPLTTLPLTGRQNQPQLCRNRSHTQPFIPAHRRTRMTAASPQTMEAAWPAFAERMKTSGEIPPLDEWHALLDIADAGGDEASKAIWVVNLMRETGRKPTPVTYEKVLKICADRGDRSAAFHLVEHMFNDKVLLGDVELPDGMEDVLRKILPPEAFE